MSKDPELHFAEFDQTGEEQVRLNLAAKNYGQPDGWKARLAEEWLRSIEASRIDLSQSEQMDLARRATKAAEEAATSARLANTLAKTANKIAKVAALMAALAIALTIWGLLHGEAP